MAIRAAGGRALRAAAQSINISSVILQFISSNGRVVSELGVGVPVGEVRGARVPCALCLFWYGEERGLLSSQRPTVAETGDEEEKVVTKKLCETMVERERKRERALKEGRLDGWVDYCGRLCSRVLSWA